MSNDKINNAIFEAFFRQAIKDDYREEIDSIPNNVELSQKYILSPAFELRMKRLFEQEKQKKTLFERNNFFRQAAIILIAIATLLFGTLLINSEARAAIKNVIIEWYDKFTSFSFVTTSSQTSHANLYPSYLPEGFFEESAEIYDNFTFIIYMNGDNERIIFVNSTGSSINIYIDNEHHLFEDHIINGHTAYLAKSTDPDFDNAVIVTTGEYVIEVWSPLSLDVIIKVAESVFEK
ncbi:MAG: DUF4367 domain-containing protein [Lachnospiraceae bacterium]|nr:DUF4367 domain-containing protein [Lachnospiraceae bacterium]